MRRRTGCRIVGLPESGEMCLWASSVAIVTLYSILRMAKATAAMVHHRWKLSSFDILQPTTQTPRNSPFAEEARKHRKHDIGRGSSYLQTFLNIASRDSL